MKPTNRGFELEDDYFRGLEGLTKEEEEDKKLELQPKSFKMLDELD